MTITNTQNIVQYMTEQYKKKRHVPSYDELFETFPKVSWMDLANARYEFESRHMEWAINE